MNSPDPAEFTADEIDLANNGFVAGLLYAVLSDRPEIRVSRPSGNTFVVGTEYTRSQYQIIVRRIQDREQPEQDDSGPES